jgi:hypothetical protein
MSAELRSAVWLVACKYVTVRALRGSTSSSYRVVPLPLLLSSRKFFTVLTINYGISVGTDNGVKDYT